MDAKKDKLLIDVTGLFNTFELKMKTQIEELGVLAAAQESLNILGAIPLAT